MIPFLPSTRLRVQRALLAGSLLAIASGSSCVVSYSSCTIHGPGGLCSGLHYGTDSGWGDPGAGGADYLTAGEQGPRAVRAPRRADAAQQSATTSDSDSEPATPASPFLYWGLVAEAHLLSAPDLAALVERDGLLPATIRALDGGEVVVVYSAPLVQHTLDLAFATDGTFLGASRGVSAPGLFGASVLVR